MINNKTNANDTRIPFCTKNKQYIYFKKDQALGYEKCIEARTSFKSYSCLKQVNVKQQS